MATYNGEKFIKEQLDSILEQIDSNAEIIVVDDNSSDNTVRIVNDVNDERIRVFKNKQNLGVNLSFELALMQATGDYIFLADQDDIWTANRVNIMLNTLEMDEGALVSGNTIAVDADGVEIHFCLGKLANIDTSKYFKNICKIFMGKAAYYGCAMAFKRELLSLILPFPKYTESHDLWIALAANMEKKNVHCEDIILKRRIHGKNASIISRSFKEKIYSRWIFAKSIYEICKRKWLNR